MVRIKWLRQSDLTPISINPNKKEESIMGSNSCSECGYQVLAYENSCPLCGNGLESGDQETSAYHEPVDDLDFSGDKFFDDCY